jgi:hypothetical protein
MIDALSFMIGMGFDVDSYLANGGQLLLLPALSPTDENRKAVEKWMEGADDGASVRIARYGEFLGLIGKQAPGCTIVGNVLSEAKLLNLWQSTRNITQIH